MNKITGYRKGFNALTKASSLDLAASIDTQYYEYTDKEYLTSGLKSLLNTSKVILGEQISKRSNEQYLNKLKENRKENYESLWYESGWLKNYRASGFRVKFSKTYYPLNEDLYTTANSQAYCLDRTIRANFDINGGFPYGEIDGFGYPEGVSSGQFFKICGFVRKDLPAPAFISPYKNIFEMADHSGYQLGSVGKNYWTKKELLNFGLPESYADATTSGVLVGTKTGQKLSYNKIYFQDNIPNLDWCLKNRCAFVYTEMIGQRNSEYDDPLKIRENQETMRRIFVFSGTTSWIQTGIAPKSTNLAYGPYFQRNNTGLYKFFNNNYNIVKSGTLNDVEVSSITIINTGDIPKNFYLSSASSNIETFDNKFKTSQFVYRNNHPLSGQPVEYYTIGKNNGLNINYKINYTKTGIHNLTLSNGTKIYNNTGGLILNEVTGTILENNNLSFLVKSTLIPISIKTIANNSRVFFDDYYFSALKENQIGIVQYTGSNLEYNLDGVLLKFGTNGKLPTSTSIFGFTCYATGSNINLESTNLKTKYFSGNKSYPSYQAQTNITVKSNNPEYIYNLNTDRQYLRYSEAFSGLFTGINGSISNTKGNFNPLNGASQLDLFFKVNNSDLPIFDLQNTKQEYISINFLSGSGYRFYDTKTNIQKNLNELILKKDYKYNLLQTNLTEIRPLAVKGDISGLKVTTPNFNKISGNYRLLQFSVANDTMPKIEYFSASQNPIIGEFSITGENLNQFLNPTFRTKVISPSMVSAERSGAKFYYSFSNVKYPELYLENNKNYKLVISTGHTGFYFYTGNSIYGSGLNEYVGTAISYIEPSGSLRQSGFNISGDLYPVTGYKKPSIRIYTISAGHIPNNLYYGDKYSAYAGNKINRISPPSELNNKFKNYVLPVITGSISLKTSDDTKENLNLNYTLIQDTGDLNGILG